MWLCVVFTEHHSGFSMEKRVSVRVDGEINVQTCSSRQAAEFSEFFFPMLYCHPATRWRYCAVCDSSHWAVSSATLAPFSIEGSVMQIQP